MEREFKKSEPTGLTTGAEIALVAGDSSTTYTVLNPGVSGRTSWQGKRIWDRMNESGKWQATTGQEGPRSGKIRLARGVGANRAEYDAKFALDWETEFYSHRREETRSRGTRKIKGHSTVLEWVMNLRRTITIEGVDYDRVVRTWRETIVLPFKAH